MMGRAFRLVPATALDVPGMSAAVHALVALQGFLAMRNMAHRTLPHLLSVVARLVHVLFAELANHRRNLL
jgi:hypothetical protein